MGRTELKRKASLLKDYISIPATDRFTQVFSFQGDLDRAQQVDHAPLQLLCALLRSAEVASVKEPGDVSLRFDLSHSATQLDFFAQLKRSCNKKQLSNMKCLQLSETLADTTNEEKV